MRRAIVIILAALCACTAWAKPRFGHLVADERPFTFEHGIQLFSAKNGLKVALLRDDRSNLVTVDVRYLVGAGDDPWGKGGMAHLVEHTTFLARAEAGGPTLADRLGEVTLSFNAWTTAEETNYTSTALAAHLDDVLDLEAARLAESCDQIDDATFARERDVVLEERAQRSGPLDGIRHELASTVWSERHPYAREVGGREIAKTSRTEACDFFTSHYSPDRAIVVITGDIDIDATSAAVAARFGPIARRDVVARAPFTPAELEGTTSHHSADVDQATALIYLPAPALDDEDLGVFDFVESDLATELAELDDHERWITSTAVSLTGGSITRVLTVGISVSDPDRLDDAVTHVFAIAAELGHVEHYQPLLWSMMESDLRLRTMRAWDSFLTRGAWIADYLAYTTDNRFFLDEMYGLAGATPQAAADWAAANLTREHSHVALVAPSGEPAGGPRVTVTSAEEHGVEPWRAPVDAAEANLALHDDETHPAGSVVEETLDNGLHVVLAPDPASPIVDARLVFPAGSAEDPPALPGLALATADILGPNYRRTFEHHVDLARVEWAFGLGTSVDADVDETATVFRSRGLALYADWHVWRLFWEVDQGEFTRDAIDSFRARVADAGDEQTDPGVAAIRERLFGKDHPYAASPVTVAEIDHIGKKELESFRRDHYRARGATLIISGGFDAGAMAGEVKDLFGPWSGDATAASAEVPPAHPATGPSWLAIHEDSDVQARLVIAFATRSDADKDGPARDIVERLLDDRLRVVRERLGASYGVSASYASGAGGGMLELGGDLDPDRAGDAIRAVLDELGTLRDPATDLDADFVRARRKAFASSLAQVAGASAVAGQLGFVAVHHLPIDYYQGLPDRIGGATVADVRDLLTRDLDERRMVVAVRGRADVVTAALAAAGAPADVTVIDAE